MKVFILDVVTLSGLGGRRQRRGGLAVSRWRRWRRWKGRWAHPVCNVTEMHHGFCEAFLLFHFFRSVSIGHQPSFIHLLQFQCQHHRRVRVVNAVRSALE